MHLTPLLLLPTVAKWKLWETMQPNPKTEHHLCSHHV